MRQLLALVVAIGPLYLGVSFGLPLALGGVALAVWEKYQGFAIACGAAAVAAALILIPPFFEAIDQCAEINDQRDIERFSKGLFEQINGTTAPPTQADIDYLENQCSDVPFT